MEHQKQILYHRIDNLHSGISKVENSINDAGQMLNHEDIDISQVQKELEEVQDFLSWLGNQ